MCPWTSSNSSQLFPQNGLACLSNSMKCRQWETMMKTPISLYFIHFQCSPFNLGRRLIFVSWFLYKVFQVVQSMFVLHMRISIILTHNASDRGALFFRPGSSTRLLWLRHKLTGHVNFDWSQRALDHPLFLIDILSPWRGFPHFKSHLGLFLAWQGPVQQTMWNRFIYVFSKAGPPWMSAARTHMHLGWQEALKCA